jgi:hypothetical protein
MTAYERIMKIPMSVRVKGGPHNKYKKYSFSLHLFSLAYAVHEFMLLIARSFRSGEEKLGLFIMKCTHIHNSLRTDARKFAHSKRFARGGIVKYGMIAFRDLGSALKLIFHPELSELISRFQN